jgi:outer membrane protein
MQKTLYKQLILVLFGLSSYALQAQDLINVYRLALKQDAELKIAEAEFRATRESLPIARSTLKPQIDFSTSISQRESDFSTTGSNTIQNSDYSFNLTQNLFNAEILATIDAAEATVAKARADLEVSQQDLVLRVAENYFDILAAQDDVEFAKAEETAIARQLEQAQKRFEVGLIAITDVREAQAQYDSAVARTILAGNLLDNAFQALQVIIAQPPSPELARLSDGFELLLPEPAQSQPWVEIALQNNRSLISAVAAQQVAAHERQIANKSRYPTLDLTASYSDSSIEDDTLLDSDLQDTTLALLLNVPLYTGGRISAERSQAEAAYQSARNVALLQKRLTSQNTRIAYLGVISGISQVKALKQALKSSTTALEATEAGFEVGTRTSVDVLISVRSTYGAQRDYASARYEFIINTLRLQLAAGLLSMDDLEKVNGWLK